MAANNPKTNAQPATRQILENRARLTLITAIKQRNKTKNEKNKIAKQTQFQKAGRSHTETSRKVPDSETASSPVGWPARTVAVPGGTR